MPRVRMQRPITYRDRQDRVWSVSEVAVLKVVAPAIDGPNVALVIRFEREGEERLARWLGDTDWRESAALHGLFKSAERSPQDTGVGPAPPETVRLWCERVKSMGPDELDDFEQGVGPRVVRRPAASDRSQASISIPTSSRRPIFPIGTGELVGETSP